MEIVSPQNKIQEKQILIDSLNINYKQIGDGDMPIILLHGWGISSDKYTETARQFKIQNSKFKILLLDLPGFGKSDEPPDAWGVDGYVEFVKRFIDETLGHPMSKLCLDIGCPSMRTEINVKTVLIGHSFGGRIAIKFAAKYPEKLKALILTGAAGIKHQPTVKQKIFFILAKIGKSIFSLPLIEKLEKPAQELLYKAAREKDYYLAEGIIKETFKKVIDEDLTGYLEKIKTPTLLVWGAKDRSTPLADGQFMHFKIQNSKLKIIDEANHSFPYQIPEKFAKIIAGFIKNDNG